MGRRGSRDLFAFWLESSQLFSCGESGREFVSNLDGANVCLMDK